MLQNRRPGTRLLCGRLVHRDARAAGVEVGGGGGRLRLRLPHQRALLRLHAPQDLQGLGFASQANVSAGDQLGTLPVQSCAVSSHSLRAQVPLLVFQYPQVYGRDLGVACTSRHLTSKSASLCTTKIIRHITKVTIS